MARRWRTGVIACLWVAGVGGVAAAEAKLSLQDEALLRLVDSHYNHLRSLRTDFSESYDGMGLHRTESGTLLLSRPGRMRWDYAVPKGKVFVVDGHYAWSYMPGDAQAQRISAKQVDDLRSPLRLLLGHAQLRRELREIVVTAEGVDGGARITGSASAPQAGFSQLTLRVSKTGVIEELTILAVDGAVTKFAFQEMRENLPISSGDFVFAPPMGVPVVDGLPPI